MNPNTNNPNQIVTGVVGTITGSRLPDNNPYTGGTRSKYKFCLLSGFELRVGTGLCKGHAGT